MINYNMDNSNNYIINSNKNNMDNTNSNIVNINNI